MAYATTAEMASFLGVALDPTRMTLCLDVVTGAIDSEAGAVFTGTVPAAVKGVCLRASARLYTNPPGDNSQSLDGQGATYGETDFLRTGEKTAVRMARASRGPVYSVPLSTPADISWPYVIVP